MLGGCYQEEYDYEEDKKNDVNRIINKINDLKRDLEDFEVHHDNETLNDFKRQIIGFCLKGYQVLNFFYCDDVYRRCGYLEGEATGLLTWLSFSELKEHMTNYALKNKGNYCHHAFLRTMSEYGMLLNSDDHLPDFPYEYVMDISLSSISEKDIYSEAQLAEIKKAKEEAEQKKKAAEEAARLEAVEKKERAEFERLKVKFGQ